MKKRPDRPKRYHRSLIKLDVIRLDAYQTTTCVDGPDALIETTHLGDKRNNKTDQNTHRSSPYSEHSRCEHPYIACIDDDCYFGKSPLNPETQWRIDPIASPLPCGSHVTTGWTTCLSWLPAFIHAFCKISMWVHELSLLLRLTMTEKHMFWHSF